VQSMFVGLSMIGSAFLEFMRGSVPKWTPFVDWNLTVCESTIEQVRSTEESGYWALLLVRCSSVPNPCFGPLPTV